MKEKWVRINTIEGYEDVKDCYWISNSDEDKIINRNNGKIKKIGFDPRGYPTVRLMTINGKVKTYRIHILKTKAFIYRPNPLSANVVRHLNDVKIDNRLENLAWGTQSDNVYDCVRNRHYNYGGAIKGLAKSHAKAVVNGGIATKKKMSKPVKCVETGMIYTSACEAERQTGIRNSSINNCCNGRYKTAGGFHWEFVDQMS